MVTVLGANSVTGGYEVENSLRFEKGSSDSLTRTFADDGNNDKFTFSGWFKRSEIGVEHRLFSSHNTGSPAGYASMQFHTSDDLIIFNYDGNNNLQFHRTDRKFRDLSAWYHIVIAYDTTQGTASNRFKLYINGVQETSFSTATYPDQNTDMYYNNNVIHYVGAGDSANGANFLSGYVSEVCLVDNAQLAADSFGEFDEDSNIWKPIKVSGLTFGNTGFYLEYKQAGTGTNASGMGADTSGNTNHFAVNNLTAVDQTVDTCTNNFATFNPLYRNTSTTLSEGNLNLAAGGSGWYSHAATIGVTTGKFYFEVKCVSLGSGSDTAEAMKIGIIQPQDMGVDMEVNQNLGNYYQASGSTGNNGSVTSGTSSARAAYTDGDIIGIAFDMTNRKIYYHKNGTYIDSGDPAAGSNGYVIKSSFVGFLNPVVSVKYNGTVAQANFGNPIVALSSGNTDADGFGNFEYAVPSGFFALCTKNLAEYG